MTLKKLGILCLSLGLFVFGFTTKSLAIQLSLNSSTNFYVDFSSDMKCDYVGITVTNNDGVTYSNLWVTISGFTNGVLSLANGDIGQYGLGKLANGQSKPAFFYLQSTNDPANSGTAYPCRFTIKIYQGYPTIGTLLTTNNFTVNEVTSGQNNANKVNSLSYTPTNNPVVGGIFKITIKGTTGNVNVGNDMAFTAATFTNWNAGAFQLVGCNIVVTDSPNYVLTNKLDTTSLTHITGQGDPYTAEYWVRAVATTSGTTPVSPVNYLNNGGGTVNHVQESVLTALSPVQASTNMTTLGSVVASTQLYTNEIVTFTLRVTNSSLFDVVIDRFVDTLPTGFVYVANSTTFGGVAMLDPTNISQVLTWAQTYAVPANSTSDFVFKAIPTGYTTGTFTTNSFIGYVQNSQIDTTVNTADNAPATEIIHVLIEPTAVNDTGTTLEDTTLNVAAPGVLANDSELNSFTMSVVSYTQPSHGSVTVSNNGGYSYVPSGNYNGSDSFTYTMTNANARASTATVNLTVTAVNDAPSYTVGSNQTVLEDSGAQSVGWATGISTGPSDESGQTVTFHISNNNSSLFSSQPSISSSGTLTYTPAANANGSATISVYLTDNGGTANGGRDTSVTNTFTITVTAVNDAPSFTKGADQASNEDAGAQTVSGWGTAISAGPSDESGQALTFHVSNNNSSLFSAQPSVASNGTLTYTAAANANGSATVTLYLTDNGGTASGGKDTSSTNTFTITINAANDAPSFTAGSDQTVLEDGGAQSIGWATGISTGPSDEFGQTVTFHVSSNNTNLFSVQPSVSSGGTLTYTPAANANGSATVSVYLTDNGGTANGGNDTSVTNTFTITVTAVNDAPSFTKGADQTSNEDAGAQTVSGWGTAISAGPSDESGQALTFHVSNNNNSLFSTQPSVASNGTLTYTAAANVSGSATVTIYLTDNGGTASGGKDTSSTNTFTVTVNAVNDVPAFTKGANISTNENSGAQTVSGWATGISAGPSDESGQVLTFHVSNDNNGLFSVQPSVSSNGTLTFTSAANTSGSATVTVYLTDNGGTANSGNDTSASQTFTITINPINHPPYFTKGSDPTALEDGGAQTVSGWATGINSGTNDSVQTLTFHVSNDNNSLFSVQPSVASNGALTYTPSANANGSATVTIYLTDDGGTAGGGNDTSPSQTFTINVTPVNDPPTINPVSDVTIVENWDLQTVNFNGITVGPANENGQNLTVTATSSNPSLVPDPTVNYTSANASGSMTFTPATNSFGSAVITVVVQDNGGTANGGHDTVTNTFTVNLVGLTNYWYSGSNLVVNIFDATGGPGSGFSRTNYRGVLDVPATSGSPFTIKPTGLADNFNYSSNYTWKIATATRGVLDFATNKIIIDSSAFTNDLHGGYFKVVLGNDGSSVDLVYVGNRGPSANPIFLARALNTSLKISIDNIITNYTTDPDGDGRYFSAVGVSTNGSSIFTNRGFIFFAPTNNIDEGFVYVIRDGRTYRPGDTVLTATNWITITVNHAVGYPQGISSGGGTVSVTFAGVPGYAYDVQRSTDLVNWDIVSTTNAPSRGVWVYTDTNPPSTAFYRTRQH